MGRAPCCDKANVKKGPWSPEEDAKLKDFIDKFGTGGNWIALPQKAGLRRCGKSCRLRWLNYLRPNIKHGEFSDEEDKVICTLYATIGSRWSIIAGQLPGRTDNDIKNYWNTKLKKKLMGMIPSKYSHPNSALSQLCYQAAATVESIYAPQNNYAVENFPIIPSTQYQEGLQYKDNNMLIFGGGSSSHGKDPVKREYGLYEETQKFMLHYNGKSSSNMMMMDGFLDQRVGDDQLMMMTSIGNGGDNCLLFNDESRGDERETYYF